MQLQHYQEFKNILNKYVVSDRAMQVLQGLKLVLLLGPTSSGRNTIIRELVKTGNYHYIVSDTTRPPRINDGVLEENGSVYWFRTEEEVLDDLKSGEFLEAELLHKQQVSGISIRELEKSKSEHKVAITDVDVGGVHTIIKIKPDTTVIMVLPPSFEEWQKRVIGRGRMMPGEEKRRYETALNIFEDGLKNDYYDYVITEDTKQSASIIEAIVEGRANPHQGRGHSIMEHLQESLREKLATMY
jgi:guanylate kinase